MVGMLREVFWGVLAFGVFWEVASVDHSSGTP